MNKDVKNSMEMLRSTLLRCAPRLCTPILARELMPSMRWSPTG